MPGYTGRFCLEEIDECASQPCQNGAICHDKIASYQCECPNGYTGLFCQVILKLKLHLDKTEQQNIDNKNQKSSAFWMVKAHCLALFIQVISEVVGELRNECLIFFCICHLSDEINVLNQVHGTDISVSMSFV